MLTFLFKILCYLGIHSYIYEHREIEIDMNNENFYRDKLNTTVYLRKCDKCSKHQKNTSITPGYTVWKKWKYGELNNFKGKLL